MSRVVGVLAALSLVMSPLLLTACAGGDTAKKATSTSVGTDTDRGRSTTTTTSSGAPPGQAVPSSGCGHSTAAVVTDERRTLTSSGVERWYLLTVPTAAAGSGPLPLLLDFHGLSEGAEAHSKMTGFDQIAQRDGFVLATPNGTREPVQWSIGVKDNADVTFTNDLIDQLGSEVCLDLSRVYSTGLSNGAMFSSVLACQPERRVAAIAPVAGLLFPDDCHPSGKVPVLTIHGTADPILYFNGGVGDLTGLLAGNVDASKVSVPPANIDGAGYPENVRKWAANNGCEPTPADTRPVPQVLLRTYGCPPDAAVEFYVVEGGGHAWPGSELSRSIASVIGPTNMDLHASEIIWSFLSRFRMAPG